MISFVTLTVDDVDRTLAFYKAWLDLADDQIRHGGDNAALSFRQGPDLVLYPRKSLAEGLGADPTVRSQTEVILSREVQSRAEMEQLLSAGVAAGGHQPGPAKLEHWGETAFLLDPDGHAWEIVCFSAAPGAN